MVLIFTLLLWSCSLAQTQNMATSQFDQPVNVQAPVTKTINIDGIEIEYLDFGEGHHTLVIESGIGMGLAYWQSLLIDLSQLKIRTVIYSRAGNGQSQASTDVSLTASNQRLEKLLTAIGATKHLILLGHSYGALHARAFAAAHPKQVKGLLLLDPSHELFESELLKYDEIWAKRDTTTLNRMMGANLEWIHLQDIYLNKSFSEGNIANHIPTVIVTSTKLNESDWWIGHSTEGKRIWRHLHQSLISSHPNSAHVVTDQTGHNIPLENKPLVLRSISMILSFMSSP